MKEVLMRSITERMIYICEYDGTIEKQSLLDDAAHLPIELGTDSRGDALEDNGTEKMSKVRWEKSRERILAWLLLEYAVEREYGYSLDELRIIRTKKGKPCSSSHPELQFNISHCETACACVVGSEDCGIDIERKFPFRESLAKKICHAQEWKCFSELSENIYTQRAYRNSCSTGKETGDAQRAQQLQILWSLKESYVKRDGRGLSYGMDQVSFAELMPFAGSGICPERSVLWNCTETYTLAACMGRKDFAAADLSQGLRSIICLTSERRLVSQTNQKRAKSENRQQSERKE